MLSLAPYLSNDDADALLQECLAALNPTQQRCRSALCALEALSRRVSDRTPFARQCLAVIEAGRAAVIAAGGRRSASAHLARLSLTQACLTLGAMSQIEPDVLLTAMRALLDLPSLTSRGWSSDTDDARFAALAQIMRDANLSQLPVLRRFMENLTPEASNECAKHTVWAAYVVRLQTDIDIEGAYRAFVRYAMLRTRIVGGPGWTVALVFMERLTGAVREAWIEQVIALAKSCEDRDYRPLDRENPQDHLAWTRCLAGIIKYGSNEQRTEILAFLDDLCARARREGIIHEMAITHVLTSSTAHFATVWRTAAHAQFTGPGTQFHWWEAQKMLRELIQAAAPAFLSEMLKPR